MYKDLRRHSLRVVAPRLIVCAVLVIALLALSGGGLLKLISGPKDIDSINPEDLSGKYVSFDASRVIVSFANLTVTGADGKSSTRETYYLLPVGDGQYIAVMDKKERNSGVLSRAMEQSHEYYLGDLDTLRTLGPVRGTAAALEEDMLKYMADCIDNYQLPGYEEGSSSRRLLVPVMVTLDRVGWFSKTWTLVFGILALVFLALFLLQLALVLTGFYQRQVRALVGDDEAAYAAAKQIERVRVGKYIWYPQGAFSHAAVTADQVWGYAMPEPMVVSKYRWPVALYDREQTMTRIQFMDRNRCEDLLAAIEEMGHPFLRGYTSQLSEKFQSDFPGFLSDAEKAAEKK